MAPKKRTTRASLAITTTTTTPVINAQFKALIDKVVANALAARDAYKSQNGDDRHNLGTGIALTWWNTHVNIVGHDAAYARCGYSLYTVGSGERKEYARTLPLCNKCKFYHNGQCTIKCANYKRVGHLTGDCRSPAATNNQRNPTCYECGNQGYYRSDFPKLKNQNHGNQTGGTGARGMVHALGGGEINQDLNNMEDDINA
ncbi:reverse transcriptase domain-containing protein [Tanacetum coccineum]